eukprot:s21_g19.t1
MVQSLFYGLYWFPFCEYTVLTFYRSFMSSDTGREPACATSEQKKDHYDFAARLCRRLDALDCWLRAGESVSERLEVLSGHVAGYEEEFSCALSSLEDGVNCVRYRLMELGTFVRNEVLPAAQLAHMFTQERANSVLWNVQRNLAENVDSFHNGVPNEDGEEETLTEDEEETGPTPRMSNLMDAMQAEQSTALANEFWHDAAEIQPGIMALLDASQEPNPRGMTMGSGDISAQCVSKTLEARAKPWTMEIPTELMHTEDTSMTCMEACVVDSVFRVFPKMFFQ